MAVSKVILNGVDLIDLTDDTVEASKVLSGITATKNDGIEITGNIATLAAGDVTVNGKTVTIPLQKYTGASGATAVTKSVAVGTITSGSAVITSLTATYNSSGNHFSITGSKDVSAPTVGTAGYVSSTEGTKNANTGGATVLTTMSKVSGGVNITGTKTVTPSISKQAISITNVTDAANGSATTTAPSSGVYVAVKSAENKGTLTATPYVSTAGYGTADHHGVAVNTATVGANESSVTYVPIKTATPAFDGGTLSGGSTAEGTNVTLSNTNNGISIQTKYSANTTAVLYNGAVNGWVKAANDAQVLAAQSISSTNGSSYYISGVTLTAPQSGTRTFSITVPNGNTTATFVFNVDSSGNVTITES